MNTTPATLSALLKSFVAEHEGGAAVEIILLTRAARAVRCKENHMVFANRPNIEVAWRLPLILMSQSTQSKGRVSTGLLHGCFSVFRGGTPQRLRSAFASATRWKSSLASPVLQRCHQLSRFKKRKYETARGPGREETAGLRTHQSWSIWGGPSLFFFGLFVFEKERLEKNRNAKQNRRSATKHPNKTNKSSFLGDQIPRSKTLFP